MPASVPVSVHSLRLRGDRLHRDALLASLDDVRWPAADDQEYLILRQLRVQATWWQAAEVVAQDTRALAAGAVSGWDSRAADAVAVRFADLADLLACLSHDLARGRAAGLWYWHGWRRFVEGGPATTITRLWCEHPATLPDLVAALASHRVLTTVCAALDDTGLVRILDSVRHVTGWPLPLPDRDAVPDVADDQPRLPRPRLDDWQAVLQTLPRAHQQRLLPLVAVTTGWQQLPQLLHHSQHWLSWYDAVARQLPVTAATPTARQTAQSAVAWRVPDPTSPDPVTDPARQPRATARADSPDARQVLTKAAEPDRPVTPGTQAQPTAAADGAVPQQPLAPEPAVDCSLAHRPAADPAVKPDTRPPATPAAETTDAEPGSRQAAVKSPIQAQGDTAVTTTRPHPTEPEDLQPTSGARFHTRQGGLFYLLNVLVHPAIAPCLQDAPEPGWQRLYRLGLHLGLDCDPPLARFLAHQLDLADPALLTDLAPLRDEARLCQLADRHYAHLDAWGPGLLAVPAQAISGRSHLDLYYPLHAVRLEIRRAGLDIDPGWLPWLGQVVHFHYRDAIEPEGNMP